jgi:DNA-binding NarL/FixJ family response regulator
MNAPNVAVRPIRILTVDDHPMLRDGIASMIQHESDMVVCGEASSGLEAIQSFAALRPDVTLLDLQLPDVHGVEVLERIRREFAEAKIIVLTTYRGDVQAMRSLKAGASGYLLKSMLRKELLESIRAVHAGRRRIPAEIAMELAQHAGDETLTEREIAVLRYVAGGQANKQIAASMSLAEETVKSHVKHILAKLRAEDRTHAVTIALRRGIMDL